MAKVHVIPHTHWDREWYFTQQDSDVLAAYNFTKVIEILETQTDYSCYHLDGQSSIVEDYLKVLPHMRDRMAKLITDKKNCLLDLGIHRLILTMLWVSRLFET